MLINDRSRLLAMTLGAAFVQSRQARGSARLESRAMRGLENVGSVRIVALQAIHSLFENRMMIRELELGVGLDVAIEAGFRLPARIDDEFSPSAPGLRV